MSYDDDRSKVHEWRNSFGRDPVMNLELIVEFAKTNMGLDPSFGIRIDGESHPVQTAHLTYEQLLTIPNIGRQSLWRFTRTTSEGIDIFDLVDTDPALFFDWEPWVSDYIGEEENAMWVTPKGFPREQ